MRGAVAIKRRLKSLYIVNDKFEFDKFSFQIQSFLFLNFVFC